MIFIGEADSKPFTDIIAVVSTFAATFLGVLLAQALATRARRNQEAEEKSRRVEQLSVAFGESAKASLASVRRAIVILKGAGKAPNVRIQSGVFHSHLAAAVEIYENNVPELRRVMIAAMAIEVTNDRLSTIADLDRIRSLQGDTPEVAREHAAQVQDALRLLAMLESQVRGVLVFLDPEGAQETDAEREKALAQPPYPTTKDGRPHT